MRRYAVLDLQADCRLYAAVKEHGSIKGGKKRNYENIGGTAGNS